MAVEIILPQWGMEMQDATIIGWLKQEGDAIQEGEPLVEIETEKIQTELESISSGVRRPDLWCPRARRCPFARSWPSSQPPVRRLPARHPPRPLAAQGDRTATANAASNAVSVQVVPAARRLAKQQDIDLAQIRGSGPNGRILLVDVESAVQSAAAPQRVQAQVTPAARRLAGRHDIDLAQIQGSGPRGRILIEDVEQAIAAQAPPAASEAQTIPITGLRQTIATRMLNSLQTMAQLTLTTEADVTDVMRIREGLARQWPDAGLSPLHLAIKATARALSDHPRLNALQREGVIELMPDINLGVAVALDEGLIVPTIRQADAKSLADIAAEARDLAQQVRSGQASIDAVSGGTFTITNLGAYDIDGFTPIINPPQVGILGLGRVAQKPAVYEGAIVVRAMMFLSLTFDHRVIDGAPAAAFLRDVKSYLEDPWWMVAPPTGATA